MPSEMKRKFGSAKSLMAYERRTGMDYDELVNKRELREHGFMEDMDRKEHENLMLPIAHDFREMEGRKKPS